MDSMVTDSSSWLNESTLKIIFSEGSAYGYFNRLDSTSYN
jgi:hypothetical protein